MANGFFLGGVAEGIAARRESDREDRKTALAERVAAEESAARGAGLGLEERRLRLAEQQVAAENAIKEQGIGLDERRLRISEQAQAFQERQAMAEQADKIIAGLMGTVKEVVAAARAVGKTPEETAAGVQPLVDKIVSLSEKTGLQSDAYFNQVQAMLSAPTSNEIAVAEARATATKRLEEARTLEAGGIARSQAEQTAGVKGIGENIDMRTFVLPGGKTVSKRADDAAGIKEALDAGGVTTSLTVQSPDISGVRSEGLPEKKELEAARTGVREMQKSIDELDQMSKAFEKTPGAAGVMGFLVENLGGYVQQDPTGVGPAVLEAAGIDMKAVADARTKAKAAIGRVLRLVSQDDSRFSDADRKLAESALGALDPRASDETVRQSARTLSDILARDQLQSVDTLRVGAGLDAKALASDDGANKMGEILMRNGMSFEQALAAVRDMRRRLGIRSGK